MLKSTDELEMDVTVLDKSNMQDRFRDKTKPISKCRKNYITAVNFLNRYPQGPYGRGQQFRKKKKKYAIPFILILLPVLIFYQDQVYIDCSVRSDFPTISYSELNLRLHRCWRRNVSMKALRYC